MNTPRTENEIVFRLSHRQTALFDSGGEDADDEYMALRDQLQDEADRRQCEYKVVFADGEIFEVITPWKVSQGYEASP